MNRRLSYEEDQTQQDNTIKRREQDHRVRRNRGEANARRMFFELGDSDVIDVSCVLWEPRLAENV